MLDDKVVIKIIKEILEMGENKEISRAGLDQLAEKVVTTFEKMTGSVMKLEDVSSSVIKFCLNIEKQGPAFVKSTNNIVDSLDKVLSKFSSFSSQLGQESMLNIDNVVKEKNQNNISNFNTELNNIPKVLKSVFLKSVDSFSSMIKFVVNTFQKIGNFIITPFKAVGNFIKNIFTSIGDFIMAPFKTISNFMKAPFKTIIETKDKAENKIKAVGDTLSGGLNFDPSKRNRDDDYKIAGVASRALGEKIVLRQTAVGVAIFWFASVLDKYLKTKNISNRVSDSITEGIGLDLAIGTAVGNIISKYTTKAFIQGVATKAVALFPTVLIGSIAAAGAAYMIDYITSGKAEESVKERLTDPNRGINRGGHNFTVDPENRKLIETKNNQRRPHERQQSGFAKGGIVQSPSTINTSNGSKLVGEAGPEAIMPLKTDASGRLGVEANVGNSPLFREFVQQLGTATILFRTLNDRVKDMSERFKDWFFNSTPVKWITNIFTDTKKEIENKGNEIREKINETIFTKPKPKEIKPSISDMSASDLASVVVDTIRKQEGTFRSVNKDDSRKGVSLGFMQWNASRARELLQQLYSVDPTFFKNTMGDSIVNAMNDPNRWSEKRGSKNRVKFTDNQVKSFEKLMEDVRMQQVQIDLAKRDVNRYLETALKIGITDPGAQMYYADLMHNFGATGAKKFLKNGMSLEDMFNMSKNKGSVRRRADLYEAASQVNLMQTEQAKVDLSEATSKVDKNIIVDLLQGIAKNTGVAVENRSSETTAVVNNTSNNSSNLVGEGLTAYQINNMIVEMMFGLSIQNLNSKYSAV